MFEAVFEQVSTDLVADLDRISRAENDPLAAMAAGGILGFAAPATTLVEVAIALSVILLGIAVAFNIKAPVAVAASLLFLLSLSLR